MTRQPYVISLAVGLSVGAIYGVLSVKSSAPPIIALLGLLGILAGEMLVKHLRGNSQVVAECLHRKDFAYDAAISQAKTAPHQEEIS